MYVDPSGHRSLKIGSRGDDVATIQIMLNLLGYNAGKADSIFGSRTQSAVIRFQKAYGLHPDGTVGNQTLTCLDTATWIQEAGNIPYYVKEARMAEAAKASAGGINEGRMLEFIRKYNNTVPQSPTVKKPVVKIGNSGSIMSGEEFERLIQDIIDYNKKLAQDRKYVYEPRDWENELQNNIKPLIDMVSLNLSDEQRKLVVDAIIIAEAQRLQEKYLTVYTASDNIIAKYITSRGLHQGLEPLYEQYPQVEKNINPLVQAFVAGFTKGLNIGLWYAATTPNIKGTSKTYSNFAKQATKNPKSTEVVLGKYNQGGVSYTKVAESRGATYFQLDKWDDVVKEVGEKNIWNINESFIRQQASANKTFILSHDPAQATGYFANEVNLLKDIGYDFIKEGSVWRAFK